MIVERNYKGEIVTFNNNEKTTKKEKDAFYESLKEPKAKEPKVEK